MNDVQFQLLALHIEVKSILWAIDGV